MKQFCVHNLLRTHYYCPICTHTVLRPPIPLSFSNFFHSLSFNAIHVQYFGFDFSCWNILLSCLSPTTTWWLFFLLYLIFNIRFNFCITMLVYLNAVRPKHRPCLSLQRKIDMVFVPTNIVRSFFFTSFFKPAPIHSCSFLLLNFFDHTLHVPHIDTQE